MALPEPGKTEIQADHQHWLREIGRWESCLELWRGEHKLLVEELARLQQVLQNHGNDLLKHEKGLQALTHEIVAAEKQMIDRAGSDISRAFIEAHAKLERDHAAERELHERVKRNHHMLLAQLSRNG